MATTGKFKRLANEVSAYGHTLDKRYVILNAWGHVVEDCRTLDEVDAWLGAKEARQIGYGGGDDM